MILTPHHTCRECGMRLGSNRKPGIEFCDVKCRIAWRNRRSSRGAELYDLFMAMRYDRGLAKVYGFWKLMCRMAQAWNDEDKAANRQSYFPPQEASMMHNKYRATVVQKGRKVS